MLMTQSVNICYTVDEISYPCMHTCTSLHSFIHLPTSPYILTFVHPSTHSLCLHGSEFEHDLKARPRRYINVGAKQDRWSARFTQRENDVLVPYLTVQLSSSNARPKRDKQTQTNSDRQK